MGIDMKDIAKFSPAAQRQILAKVSAAEQAKKTIILFPGTVEKKSTDVRVSKLGNKPTHRVVGENTIKFASKKEACRFDELMLLLAAGQIRKLRLQEQYLLKPSYVTEDGVRIRGISYYADFSYERKTEPDCNGQVYWLKVVEDSKGHRTKDYIIKKKLMHEVHGIDIKEV